MRTSLVWFNKIYEEFYGRARFNKLIDLMICSEALFLDDKFYRHTGSVIGTACSMLIGENDDEREDIKNAFEDAYAIRNKEVHGGDLGRLNPRATKRLKNLEDFNNELISYLRRAIKKLLI